MAKDQASPRFMPPMSGDGGERPGLDDNGGERPRDDNDQPVSFRNWMKLHLFQYENLKRWSEGILF